jgi:hypothetical protein
MSAGTASFILVPPPAIGWRVQYDTGMSASDPGYIGEEGFRRSLRHPKLRNKAFVLETPYDDEGDDARSLETLKRLCRKSSTITTKSS